MSAAAHMAGDGSTRSTGLPHDGPRRRPVEYESAGDDAGEHFEPGPRRGMVDAGCYASGAALGCVATMAARRIHYYLSIKSIPGF